MVATDAASSADRSRPDSQVVAESPTDTGRPASGGSAAHGTENRGPVGITTSSRSPTRSSSGSTSRADSAAPSRSVEAAIADARLAGSRRPAATSRSIRSRRSGSANSCRWPSETTSARRPVTTRAAIRSGRSRYDTSAASPSPARTSPIPAVRRRPVSPVTDQLCSRTRWRSASRRRWRSGRPRLPGVSWRSAMLASRPRSSASTAAASGSAGGRTGGSRAHRKGAGEAAFLEHVMKLSPSDSVGEPPARRFP